MFRLIFKSQGELSLLSTSSLPRSSLTCDRWFYMVRKPVLNSEACLLGMFKMLLSCQNGNSVQVYKRGWIIQDDNDDNSCVVCCPFFKKIFQYGSRFFGVCLRDSVFWFFVCLFVGFYLFVWGFF